MNDVLSSNAVYYFHTLQHTARYRMAMKLSLLIFNWFIPVVCEYNVKYLRDQNLYYKTSI